MEGFDVAIGIVEHHQHPHHDITVCKLAHGPDNEVQRAEPGRQKTRVAEEHAAGVDHAGKVENGEGQHENAAQYQRDDGHKQGCEEEVAPVAEAREQRAAEDGADALLRLHAVFQARVGKGQRHKQLYEHQPVGDDAAQGQLAQLVVAARGEADAEADAERGKGQGDAKACHSEDEAGHAGQVCVHGLPVE